MKYGKSIYQKMPQRWKYESGVKCDVTRLQDGDAGSPCSSAAATGVEVLHAVVEPRRQLGRHDHGPLCVGRKIFRVQG